LKRLVDHVSFAKNKPFKSFFIVDSTHAFREKS
jgi:hypothetical protein